MDYAAILIFWWFALRAATRRELGPLTYLLFASVSFGSFATLPTKITGGLTILPVTIISLLYIARTVFFGHGKDSFVASALNPRRLMLLFLFWLVAIFSTLFFPRFFAGQVEIISVRGVLSTTTTLYPTIQNVTQLFYLSISILLVFTFAYRLQDLKTRQMALRALYFGGIVAVVTGLLDFASQFLPISGLLDPFRTASYSLLIDNLVLGQKRIVGLMPEASSYSNLCLSFLCAIYFLRFSVSESMIRSRNILLVAVALLAMVWLSTSSGGLVGLCVFLALAGFEWAWRLSRRKRLSRKVGFRLLIEGKIIYLAIACIVVAGLVSPSIYEPIYALFDRMVLNKSSSFSFEERGMWRRVSWEAALATNGLGVGVGSTRSSSSIVAVISQTGFLGAILFYGFALQTYLRRANRLVHGSSDILMGLRLAFVAPFLVASVTGSIDFGVFNAFFFGIAAAVSASYGDRRYSQLKPINVTIESSGHH